MTLTQEALKRELHYNETTGEFTRLIARGGQKIGALAGYINKCGYRQISLNDTPYLAHRLAWLYVHGYFPKEIDHINQNKADNRLVNLRECTHQQNSCNTPMRKNNTSGHRGVYLFKPTGRWMVSIMHNKKIKHLGFYVDKEEAILVRKKAEIEYYGEYRVS